MEERERQLRHERERLRAPAPEEEAAKPVSKPPFMPFKLDGHKVDPNELLDVLVCDEQGSGGAHHNYGYYFPGRETVNMGAIRFQKGPIKEVGVNGLTHEVLLSIVKHRLECFQRGPFPSEWNEKALQHVTAALTALKARTLDRQERGVEGRNEK
jgi:hypothetical protein